MPSMHFLHLNTPDKHIMTAEDPVEIELDGIIQTQVNPQIGLDFSRLLRTFLRQDPDIITVSYTHLQDYSANLLQAINGVHLL